jgi:uncharacterized protein (DUF2062 family)
MQATEIFKEKFFKLVKFGKDLFSKKTLTIIAAEFNNPDHSDEFKAFSAAFGVFMGLIPVWGVQTVIAIFVAMFFRLNKALVVVFSQVSFPPLLPFIVWLSYKVGYYWIGTTTASKTKISLQTIDHRFLQYVYGSLTLALVAAIAVGLLTFASLKLLRLVKQYRLTTSLKKAI